MKKLILAALLTLSFTGTSHALLQITLSTADQTLTVTGADDGGANFNIDQLKFVASWAYSDGSAHTSYGSVAMANYFPLNGGSGTTASGYLRVYNDGLVFDIESGNSFGFIEGGFSSISYAGLSELGRSKLESFVGVTLTLAEGSDYNPVSVTAVPEPAIYAAVTGLTVLCLIFLRAVASRPSHTFA